MARRRSKVRAALKKIVKGTSTEPSVAATADVDSPDIQKNESPVSQESFKENQKQESAELETLVNEENPRQAPQPAIIKEATSEEITLPIENHDIKGASSSNPPPKKDGKKRRRRKSSRVGGDDSSEMMTLGFLGGGIFLLLVVVIAFSLGGDQGQNDDVELYQNAAGELITREEFEAIEKQNQERRKAALALSQKNQLKSRTETRPSLVIDDVQNEDSSSQRENILVDRSSVSDSPAPGWMRGNLDQDDFTQGAASSAQESKPKPPSSPQKTESPPAEISSTSTDEPETSTGPVSLKDAEGWP